MTFVAGPVGSGAGDLRQPRPGLRRARPRARRCATSSRPTVDRRAWASTSTARVPTTCRATRRTWWSARCAPPSTPWAPSRPGCGWPAATSSRTPAAWARRRPRSSPVSAWPGRWSPAGRSCSTTTRPSALAAELEGHPDNVAPAFYGGFTDLRRDDGRVLRGPRRGGPAGPGGGVRAADAAVDEVARGLLPERRAARRRRRQRRPGRAAGRRAGRQPELLLAATEDWLHQDYREPAMPDSLALVDARCAPTAVPAVVSGAGPDRARLLTDGPTARRYTAGRASGAPRLDVATDGVRPPVDRGESPTRRLALRPCRCAV